MLENVVYKNPQGGLLATLKGVPRRAEAAAAAGACPSETRIGTAVTKAGPSEAPVALSGPASCSTRRRAARRAWPPI